MPTRIPALGPQVPLRELRKAHSLTLAQLAERIAAVYPTRPAEGTLANIELGRQLGSRPLMVAWARALAVSPMHVLQDDELRAILAGPLPPLAAAARDGEAA